MKFIRKAPSQKRGKWVQRFGVYLCPECGENVVKRIGQGERDKTCGCNKGWHMTTHGETRGGRTRLYITWQSMHERCRNKNIKSYKHYGAKGVAVCSEWSNFIEFKKWALLSGYTDKLTIDRIDNNKNYCPENCRFIPIGENSRKRKGVFLSFKIAEEIRNIYAKGDKKQYEIAAMYGIHKGTVSDIVRFKRWASEHID